MRTNVRVAIPMETAQNMTMERGAYPWCTFDMNDPEARSEDSSEPYVTVRAASEQLSYPVRSIYNGVDRGVVRTRSASDSKQTLLVNRQDVQRLADARAAGASAGTLPGQDWQSAGNGTSRTPASAEVLAARDRVELHRLEALEHRAREEARRAESEAILADAERERRREAAILTVERERVALQREAARAAEERAEAAQRARREGAVQREAAAERERRATAEAAQVRNAQRRASWESKMLREIDQRIAERLGRPDLVPLARTTARRALCGLAPTDPDDLVLAVLDSVLRRDLADAHAEHDLRARHAVALEVAGEITAYDRAEVVAAVRDAALAAAAREPVPIDSGGRARIARVARDTQEAALDEVLAREQREQVDAMFHLATTLRDFWRA